MSACVCDAASAPTDKRAGQRYVQPAQTPITTTTAPPRQSASEGKSRGIPARLFCPAHRMHKGTRHKRTQRANGNGEGMRGNRPIFAHEEVLGAQPVQFPRGQRFSARVFAVTFRWLEVEARGYWWIHSQDSGTYLDKHQKQSSAADRGSLIRSRAQHSSRPATTLAVLHAQIHPLVLKCFRKLPGPGKLNRDLDTPLLAARHRTAGAPTGLTTHRARHENLEAQSGRARMANP